MAEFIDSEAKDYGEIGSDIKDTSYSSVSWCCGSGLSQKAEEEFSSTHSTLKYDYLNAVNETIQNVGRITVYCISQRYETILCVFQIVSSGGHIDNARDEVHDALKYLDKYEAVW